MDERRLELKVGALLLVAVAAGLTLLWLMGELRWSKGPRVTVQFGHTGNVVKGAPVKLGGVPVGRVEAISLLPDRRDAAGEPLPVDMELSVTPAVISAMRSDAAVTVATQGPLGEPYLELYTGSAQKSRFDPKAPIRGVDAPRLDQVANRLSLFLSSASKVLEEDPQAITRLVSGVSGLSKSVEGVLTENRDDIHTLASELSQAAKDLRTLALLARKDLEPGGRAAELLDDASTSARALKTDLPQLSIQAKLVLAGLANATGSITPEDGKKLHEAIASLDEISQRGDRLLARIEAGEGTAGRFAKDPQLYDDLKTLVTDLKKHPWKILWRE